MSGNLCTICLRTPARPVHYLPKDTQLRQKFTLNESYVRIWVRISQNNLSNITLVAELLVYMSVLQLAQLRRLIIGGGFRCILVDTSSV